MPGWKNRGGGPRDPDKLTRAVQAADRRQDRRAKTDRQAQEAERNALALNLLAAEIVDPDARLDGEAAAQETNPVSKGDAARDSV
ncbi:hypothetical protein E9232_002463 [Inquilinus ginsengisoli]|uniref:Uncharacterized protein n=1 Tax=Inquilinus ginsengisoli TaxID=363840 RepID=A0ABU1JMU9_9PROT|nr:hypothetical protein [Inquilinus ginsengisoli]MDR6289942.1 hypothetical protein [Inquilinus ginsengisoli]